MLRRMTRITVFILGFLVIAFLAAEGWARLNLDSSSVARAIAWKDADVDDHLRFPSRSIRAGPETWQLGVSPPEASRAIDAITSPEGGTVDRRAFLEETETTAFIVLRGGDLVVEEYYGDASHGSTMTSFSIAKSFMSTLFGIAIDEGSIGGLDEPITDYLPELAERDERFGRITIRHLMTMSSGLRYEEQSMPWSDDTTTYYAPDLRAAAMEAEIERPPGEVFHYNNYNLLLAGMILERATGEHIADYMGRVLWQPMGAEADASWSLDSEASGFEKSESGVNAVAMDFARFGLLFLRGGRNAEGTSVVPEDWVAAATADDRSTDPASMYQYWWWIDTQRAGRFYAAGNKGQFVYVAPDKDAVIVRMGRDYGVDGSMAWVGVLRDVADRLRAT